MFENLSSKLDAIFKRLKSHGKLTEQNIKEALKEVRIALLEADVNFKVVKDFIQSVEQRAIGQEVMASLTPAQQLIKIVKDELTSLMGDGDQKIHLSGTPPVPIMLVGLHGCGKTTTAAKLARYFQERKKRPYLIPADVYRPAAIEQLQKLGEELKVDFYRPEASQTPSILYGLSIASKQATMVELWTAKDFQLYLDTDLIESKPNPYGFIPFVIFPNLREPKKFWGTSDIPSLISPQRELNRALSQLSRILELSGNPIAVLENIASAEDIKVQPGALWTIPEDAKAYLLDLLQGGGVRLHVDYIELLYRALHDISETPRAAWGGAERDISGTAMAIELGSLVQKVTRKRTTRTNAYHQRNEMILELAHKYTGDNFEDVTHTVTWGLILPQDAARQAQNEQLLVQAGVHSRRTAMDELGIQDPDEEFTRWLEERKKILEMNREFRASSTRGGARERAIAAEMEVPE